MQIISNIIHFLGSLGGNYLMIWLAALFVIAWAMAFVFSNPRLPSGKDLIGEKIYTPLNLILAFLGLSTGFLSFCGIVWMLF